MSRLADTDWPEALLVGAFVLVVGAAFALVTSPVVLWGRPAVIVDTGAP